MIWLPIALVFTIEVLLLAATGYLLLLVVASCFPRGSPDLEVEPRRRFAILVPAHNEERVIGRLLRSLSHLDYPRALVDVHVVADDCRDGTSAVARTYGARAHVRRATSAGGKGQALRWLIDRLPNEAYDAYVVVDADSVVSPDFLGAVNARLEEGSQAVQGYYGVLNADESWLTALRALALSLLHHTRRLGLAALGASAGLAGNGMAFAADLREIREWGAFGLTEDLELHTKLVNGGIKVAFAPEAVVLAEMPTSLAHAKSQNMRWETGRLALARAHVPRLLTSGLRGRDWSRLCTAMDLLVPPQSIQLLLALAVLTASFALGSSLLIVLGVAIVVGQAVYALGGLARAGVPLRLWLALAYVPIYALWKGRLYLRALLARRPLGWIRTPREPSPAAGDTELEQDGHLPRTVIEKMNHRLRRRWGWPAH